MEHQELIIIAGVLATGVLCQWIAWRIKLPAIIPLLAAGLIAGPLVLDVLHPRESLGNLFFPIISLSVAVILFEGALTLDFREVRQVVGPVRRLLLIGSLITWGGGAVAAHYIVGLAWDLSLLFGALVVVTGPTVISPLLRNVRPSASVASVLKWEGIIIDPVGATLAVLVFNFIVAERSIVEGEALGAIAAGFLTIVGVGTILGLLGSGLLYLLLRHYLIPDYLRDATVLGTVSLVFAVSDQLASESGLLAVTVMGIALANTRLKQLREIWYFKEKLSILLISTLFILLAANFTREDLALLNWRSLVLLAVVMLVLRPLSVQASTLGSSLTKQERLFLSWIGPRGIVAAAVSSLFAFELREFGLESAQIIVPLTFLVIVGTVLLQGLTAKPFARWLGVSDAEPQGFLIMGITPFSMELAQVLQSENFTVRMIDTNWNAASQARLKGLEAKHGNILSDFFESDLDLSGMGRLLALTSNDEANSLACLHLEDEFGSAEVYQLPPRLWQRADAPPDSKKPSSNNGNGKHANKNPNRYQLARLLFTEEATWGSLEEAMEQGAVVKKTPLTENFTYEDFARQHDNQFVPLMLLRGVDSHATIATVEDELRPQAGFSLISLLLNPLDEAEAAPASAVARPQATNGAPSTAAALEATDAAAGR